MTHILIADDNENNRLTLELLLEDIDDVIIHEATNGQEAIDRCAQAPISLIFMDIMMPVMDGIEATKQIKHLFPESMVIAISALDDNESKHKMLAVGAEDYLTKPVDSELFLQRTRNYLSILKNRTAPTLMKEAINPFNKTIFHRQLYFYIPHESALVEFWDFFLKDAPFTCKDMSDHVRIIYGIGLWLLKNNAPFQILFEGDEDYVYLSMLRIGSLKKTILLNICNRHLPDASYIASEGCLYFKLTKLKTSVSDVIETNDEAKSILSKTHHDGITAVEYVENTAISIMPKIESLEFLETRIDAAIIDFENNGDDETLEILCAHLEGYKEVLDLLTAFEHLSFAVNSLIIFLRTLKERHIEKDKLQTLCTSLLNLLHDLGAWREQIFIKQEALNIHYLDASLLSSCMQIEAIFEEKVIDEGDDLEFF